LKTYIVSKGLYYRIDIAKEKTFDSSKTVNIAFEIQLQVPSALFPLLKKRVGHTPLIQVTQLKASQVPTTYLL